MIESNDKKRKIDLILPIKQSSRNDEPLFEKNKFDQEIDKFLSKKIKEGKRKLTQAHIVRFIEWNSSSINAMCVNPTENMIAIGRSDASIEIRNIKGNVFYKRIPGIHGNKTAGRIQCMCWINSKINNKNVELLLTAGLNGFFTLWDLETLKEKQTFNSFGGAIWSMKQNFDSTKLALGCEDGTIRIFEVEEGEIRYKSFLKSNNIEVRILSLAWSPDGNVLAAGNNAGSIQVYNMKTEKLKFVIDSKSKKATPVYIWALEILNDVTICSGDSQGRTMFWDGITGTLLQSFDSHQSDILVIAKDKNENIYLSGVDQKVCKYTKNKYNSKWVEKSIMRFHTNDVNSLCVANGNLISGSLDTRFFSIPLDQFELYRGGKTHVFPYQETIKFSRNSRFIGYLDRRKFSIYALSPSINEKGYFLKGDKVNVDYIPVIQFKTDNLDNISCTAMTEDTDYVAFSSVSKIFLYKLDITENTISLNVVDLPENLAKLSATKMLFKKFEKKNYFIFVEKDLFIHIYDLENGKTQTFDLASHIKSNQNIPTHGSLGNSIHQVTISSDAQWLACSDVCGNIFVFNLNTFSFHHLLVNNARKELYHIGFNPYLDSEDPCVSHLVMLYNPIVFVVFDVKDKQEYKYNSPRPLNNFNRLIHGICFKPHKKFKVYFYGYDHRGSLDYFPNKNSKLSYEMIEGIVGFSYFDQNELVLVKRTYADIAKTLPFGFVKKKYF